MHRTAAYVESEIACLIERREALGISREDLSELLDVHPNTVARWERGHTCSLSDWIRWRRALGLLVPLQVDAERRKRWRARLRQRKKSRQEP